MNKFPVKQIQYISKNAIKMRCENVSLKSSIISSVINVIQLKNIVQTTAQPVALASSKRSRPRTVRYSGAISLMKTKWHKLWHTYLTVSKKTSVAVGVWDNFEDDGCNDDCRPKSSCFKCNSNYTSYLITHVGGTQSWCHKSCLEVSTIHIVIF